MHCPCSHPQETVKEKKKKKKPGRNSTHFKSLPAGGRTSLVYRLNSRTDSCIKNNNEKKENHQKCCT